MINQNYLRKDLNLVLFIINNNSEYFLIMIFIIIKIIKKFKKLNKTLI